MANLFQSFTEPLPNKSRQIIEPTQAQLHAHISGTNTRNCFPPISGFAIPVEHWLGKAEDLCLSIPQHRSILEQSGPMPCNEEAQLIYSEQDVVNASTLHFTHSVNIALKLVHQNDYYRCEVTKGKSDATPDTPSDGTASRSRVDTLYFKGLQNLGNQSTPNEAFACLEFKRIKSLNAEKFGNWIVRTKEAHQGRLDARKYKEPERDPLMRDVSTILSQATHYCLKFNTPFVALFDWNTLILLVLSKAEKKHPKSLGGDYAYMTVITDSRLYRKAFLGFLLCAHQHAERNADWQTGRDGTDILTKAADLGSMTGGAGRSTTRSGRAAAATYREPSSSSSSDHESSQGSRMQLDNMRRTAQNAHASVSSANARKPPAHSQTSSVKGHNAPAVGARVHGVTNNTASLTVRQKPKAAKTDTRVTAPKMDARATASKTATKTSARA